MCKYSLAPTPPQSTLKAMSLLEISGPVIPPALACPLDIQAVGTTLMHISYRSLEATTAPANGLAAHSACSAHFRLPLVSSVV